MNIGDEFLVHGKSFFEKAKLIEKKKINGVKTYILSNGIKMRRDLTCINSKFTVEPFNEVTYKALILKYNLPKKLRLLSNISVEKLETLGDEDILTINKRVSKIMSILGLNMV